MQLYHCRLLYIMRQILERKSELYFFSLEISQLRSIKACSRHDMLLTTFFLQKSEKELRQPTIVSYRGFVAMKVSLGAKQDRKKERKLRTTKVFGVGFV